MFTLRELYLFGDIRSWNTLDNNKERFTLFLLY